MKVSAIMEALRNMQRAKEFFNTGEPRQIANVPGRIDAAIEILKYELSRLENPCSFGAALPAVEGAPAPCPSEASAMTLGQLCHELLTVEQLGAWYAEDAHRLRLDVDLMAEFRQKLEQRASQLRGRLRNGVLLDGEW